MAASRFPFTASRLGLLSLLLIIILFCGPSSGQKVDKNGDLWIQAQDSNGKPILLRDDRKPALYTSNFGDCQGDSLINVTRFDAAYYKDNMTVVFHLEGNTAVKNESLMSTSDIQNFSVYANHSSVHRGLCIRIVSLRSNIQSL